MEPETRTCVRCDHEYEAYLVYVKDDFVALVDHATIRRKWGNVCQDCREEVAHPDGYATEPITEDSG